MSRRSPKPQDRPTDGNLDTKKAARLLVESLYMTASMMNSDAYCAKMWSGTNFREEMERKHVPNIRMRLAELKTLLEIDSSRSTIGSRSGRDLQKFLDEVQIPNLSHEDTGFRFLFERRNLASNTIWYSNLLKEKCLKYLKSEDTAGDKFPYRTYVVGVETVEYLDADKWIPGRTQGCC